MRARPDVLAYVTGREPGRIEVPGLVYWPLHMLAGSWRAFRVIVWPFILIWLAGTVLNMAAAGHDMCDVKIYIVQEATDPFEQFDLFVTNEQIEAFQEVQASRCAPARILPF